MASKQSTCSYHAAAAAGDVEVLQQLLSADAEPTYDERDVSTWKTPLYVASEAGHVDCARLLIRSGATLNTRAKKRFTPLHAAVLHGHAALAKELVSSGAGLEKKTIRSMTALTLASKYRQLDCVVCLLELGADPGGCGGDMFGRRPLHWAVKTGCAEIIDLLVSHGACLRVSDKFGKTPIMQAAKSGQSTALRRLMTADADVTTSDRRLREPVHRAAQRGHWSCLRTLLDLARPPVSVDARTRDGQNKTVLMFAAADARPDIVRKLLRRSAYPDYQDCYGLTALSYVVVGRILASQKYRCSNMWLQTALCLCRNGNADVNVATSWRRSWRDEQSGTSDRTAVELALLAGFDDLVRLLAVAGAHPRQVYRLFAFPTLDLPAYARKNITTVDWLRRRFRSPRPLRELCRWAVRATMSGSSFEARLDQLHLAPATRSYLLYEDMYPRSDEDDIDEDDDNDADMKDNRAPASDTEAESEPSVFDSDLYGDSQPYESNSE